MKARQYPMPEGWAQSVEPGVAWQKLYAIISGGQDLYFRATLRRRGNLWQADVWCGRNIDTAGHRWHARVRFRTHAAHLAEEQFVVLETQWRLGALAL